ncbi:MAG: hypothetical protein KDK71_09725, partial [Chlamydiia bacterium]|nr:hypothetical protein [Chlamydiia bacterium]
VLVASCANTATYKPQTAIVGYTDRHIFQNKYEVSFRGGKNTPMQHVWEWAYKRAAEVTLENNYRYFVVTDEEERYYQPSKDHEDSDSLTKSLIDIGGPFPEVTLKIKCYKDRPKNADDAINAEELIRGNVEVPPSTN